MREHEPGEMTIAELIARLESATGPDLELDGAIARLIMGWTLEKRKGDRKPYWRKAGVTDYFIHKLEGPPRYTKSLDAIIALVENVLPDWDWEACSGLGSMAEATMTPQFHSHMTDTIRDTAKSPALALCVVFARAYQAVNQTEMPK